MTTYEVGDRIGGTDLFTGCKYIGTVQKVNLGVYKIKVDGGGMFFLNHLEDKVKPVYKSRSIVYV